MDKIHLSFLRVKIYKKEHNNIDKKIQE